MRQASDLVAALGLLFSLSAFYVLLVVIGG